MTVRSSRCCGQRREHRELQHPGRGRRYGLAVQEIVQLQLRKHTLASHGIFNPETISRYVHESYVALYRTARLNQRLPALTERFTTGRLTALAQAKGTIAKPVPEILFLCVHNAGRSQMAAALMTHHAQGRVNVRSAGSAPDATVSASAAAVLTAIGISLDEAFPKPLTDDVLRAADVVVTMGCGDACPIISCKRYLNWNLADPSGDNLNLARRTRRHRHPRAGPARRPHRPPHRPVRETRV